MKTKTLSDITCILMAFIFVYTGASKLLDISNFQSVLYTSDILKPIYKLVSWFIPSIEIVTGLVLAFAKSKVIGLSATVILLILFTAYISAMLITQKQLGCSCGGVIAKLSWRGHIVFNLSLLALSAYTLYRIIKEKILPAGKGEPVLLN